MTESNQQEQNTKERPVDLGALTDEQISNMSPSEVEAYLKGALNEEQAGEGETAGDASESATEQNDAQSTTSHEEEDTGTEQTGGAESDFQSLDPYEGAVDSTSADQSTDAGNEEATGDATDQSGADDQSAQADGDAETEAKSSDEDDWKAKYEALKADHDRLLGVIGSFKASGRTVKVESPDDAVRLMQMGYDYTNKMRDMKPHLRLLKTLEHNDLLEPEKINFAIDLLKGNSEAVKKFLKDRKIDPIDLDLEDGTDYKPNDHQVSEEQFELDSVLEGIQGRETFQRTAQVITKEWDKASQDVLMGIPRLIEVISDHMEKGYYDRIADKVRYERAQGRLRDLSDLDAYKAVGDAMEKQGAFAPTTSTNETTPTSSQESSQNKGSRDNDQETVQDRKRKATIPRGKPGAGKAPPKNYLGEFSDEEIENMGMPRL